MHIFIEGWYTATIHNNCVDFELYCLFNLRVLVNHCQIKTNILWLKVYEEIASHFSETRHKPWPNVKNFVESQELGAVILDVGCGNGKYLGLNSRAFQVIEFPQGVKKVINLITILSDWL